MTYDHFFHEDKYFFCFIPNILQLINIYHSKYDALGITQKVGKTTVKLVCLFSDLHPVQK